MPQHTIVLHVALLLLCFCHGSWLTGAVSPTAPTWEETLYKAEQEAKTPVGRPDFQAAALARFAASLAADPYGVLPLWSGDSHPCGDASNNYKPWPGITCDAPTGYITKISLHGKGLVGRLPESLSVLKSIRTLDLGNNSFEGTLPSSWSNLTSLESLDVSLNRLTGSLPPTFSSLSNIQTLDLHRNKISGPLPATWASMTLLEVLDLSYNQLTSTLPPAWAQLSYLSVLNLKNNSLEGALPPAWAEQRSLLQLNIGNNRIEGVLPPQWAGGMDSLRGIDATGNAIQGSLPLEWSNMTSLQSLSVSQNQLTGSIPSTWSGLHNLYVVNVTHNEGLCGGVPDGVAGVLNGKTGLHSRCRWTEDAHHLLDFKSGLQDPQQALYDWKRGSNPCGVEPWQGVVCSDGWVVAIRLQDKQLRGPLTPGLVNLSQLEELRLRNNQLTGTLPNSWGPNAPSSLVTIDMSNNTLDGTLPADWGQLTSLTYLDLSSNQLAGQLPDEWGNLQHLTTLLLSNNHGLNGTLPAAWGALTALSVVRLDQGNLTGSLPSAWSKLTMLKEMSLSSNALTGSVPSNWNTKLGNLHLLDLSGNQRMCGTSPSIDSISTVRTTLTALGQDCSTLAGPSQQLSGTMGVIIGVCLGIAGSVLLAGSVYLVVIGRRRLVARPPPAHTPSAMATSRSLPVPTLDPGSPHSASFDYGQLPRPSSAGVMQSSPSSLKVFHSGSASCSPVPFTTVLGRSSPMPIPGLCSSLSSGALSPTGTSSQQLLPSSSPQHRLAIGSVPLAYSASPRPFSPLGALAASGDSFGPLCSDSYETPKSSFTVLGTKEDASESVQVLKISHSAPSSPAGYSIKACSAVGEAENAMYGTGEGVTAGEGSHDPSSCMLSPAMPASPRSHAFDGPGSATHNSPRPGSAGGLKLHVATVLRASAAASAAAAGTATEGSKSSLSSLAGAPVIVRVEGAGNSWNSDETAGDGAGSTDESQEVASPRAQPLLGVAAAAAVPLPGASSP